MWLPKRLVRIKVSLTLRPSQPLKKGSSKIEVVGVDIADEDINPIEVQGNYGWIVIR